MENVTVVMAIGFLICFLLYQIIKNHVVNDVNKAMQKQEYERLLKQIETPLYRKFLGSFVCDLYKLRCYLNQQDDTHVKQYLMETLEKTYTLEQRKEILDLYYYHYLFLNDATWSAKLLEKIKETNDGKYIRYNEEAYAVMVEKRTDLLDSMINGIENKEYSGLGLGIAVCMIGMQYWYLGDKENARAYFYNSLSCFHAKSFYYAKAKEYVDQLTEELDAVALDY